MLIPRILNVLLLLLLVMAGLMRVSHEAPGRFLEHPVQNGFLFVLPPVLMVLLTLGIRWALMAAVLYGTIGLALDISTLVQEATADAPQPSVLLLGGISGIVNFCLIGLGGYGFLDLRGSSASPQGAPPAPRRPNPPSRPEA